MIRRLSSALLLSMGMLVGCGGSSSDSQAPAGPPPYPPQGSTWQWQLLGALNSEYDVFAYDIDLFNTAAETIASLQQQGRFVICYFSAGSYESYREDAGEFLDSELGNTLANFANERWLDTRSSNVRAIMRARMDLAAAKGCDAVEPDNVDGHINNTGFALTRENSINYSQFIAEYARSLGLYVGLKNNVGLAHTLEPYFDFAVNESCFRFNECARLAPFVDAKKAVFHVEYLSVAEVGSGELQRVCAQTEPLGFSTLVLPTALNDAYRFSCSEQ